MFTIWAFIAAFDKTQSQGHSGEKVSIKRLTSSIIFLTSLYGSLFSFMIEMNVKHTNISPLNLKTFLLLFFFYENATHFKY